MDRSSMLSIKQFSEISGIPQSTLRYYDQIGLFLPALRGENHYRYYAPFQMVTVNFVNLLVDLGVPLTQISFLAQNREPCDVLDMLMDRQTKLDSDLRKLQENYSIIHTFQHSIQNGLLSADQAGKEVSMVRMEETPIILGKLNNWSDGNDFYDPFIQFLKEADINRINLNYPVGGYFRDIKAFLEDPSQPTRFYSMDPTGASKKEAGDYIVAFENGYYGTVGTAPTRITSYAAEHNLEFTGPLYVFYLLDEISIRDLDQYLSEFCVAVVPKK